jgi:hypothetical protein
MQICCQALTFFLLHFNRGIEHHFLLFNFHLLQFLLKTLNSALVHNNKHYKADGKDKHPNSAQK